MPIKSVATGSVFRVLYPPAAERHEQAEFRLRVLTARQRARLTDLDGGVIQADGTVRTTPGAYTLAALEEGLDGWDLGEVVFGEDHDAVKTGKKKVGDPVEFRSLGGKADHKSLDALPPDCRDWLAMQVTLGNTVTSAEKKELFSVPVSPSTGPSSIAPDATSATATTPETSGGQGEGSTLRPAREI